MKVQKLELFSANLPFRFSFKHAAAQRAFSESLFVKLTMDNGIIGWGEGLPRPYVTGETMSSASEALRAHLTPLVLGERLEKPQDAYALAGRLSGEYLPGEADGGVYFGAARCALETALLDAVSRGLNMPFFAWLGPVARKRVYATAVIPEIPPEKMWLLLWAIRLGGFKAVKVKVGTARDEENLTLVRKILGPKISLLVDANGAWQADEAIEKLQAWKKFGIGVVEQPVAARDFEGMHRIREATKLDVMADESLRSLQDAENLIDSRACSIFNIRLSKCGGMLSSWRIFKLARASGLCCQLGCQVGESSVLASAGKCFALCTSELMLYEGGYGRFLLCADVAKPTITLGWRGGVSAGGIAGKQGLGVCVVESLLKSYAKEIS